MVPPFHSSILYSNIIYYINLFCSFVFYVVTALNAAVLKDISLDIDLIKFAFFFMIQTSKIIQVVFISQRSI